MYIAEDASCSQQTATPNTASHYTLFKTHVAILGSVSKLYELDMGNIPKPILLSCKNISSKYTSHSDISSFKTQFPDLLIKVLPGIS
jgi:hypothetical protein